MESILFRIGGKKLLTENKEIHLKLSLVELMVERLSFFVMQKKVTEWQQQLNRWKNWLKR